MLKLQPSAQSPILQLPCWKWSKGMLDILFKSIFPMKPSKFQIYFTLHFI